MMAKPSYGQVTEEGFLTLLDALYKGAWGAVEAPQQPSPQALLALGVVALCKVQLQWVLLAMRRVLHPKPEDAAAIFDQDWDRVQRLWHSDIVILENSKDPQTQADGALLREATLKGQGTAQTAMRYEAEVQWGVAQVQKADEPTLREVIERHHLQDRLNEIAASTRALAEAIGWDTTSHKHLSPSVLRRTSLRQCAETCALVHHQLELLLERLPHTSSEASQLEALLAPLQKLQSLQSQPAPTPAPEGEPPTPSSI